MTQVSSIGELPVAARIAATIEHFSGFEHVHLNTELNAYYGIITELADLREAVR